jgi:hypothetical protein
MTAREKRVARRLEVPLLVAALLTVPVIVIQESHFGEPWKSIAGILN